MSTKPIFCLNDVGGIVYVCKNEICIAFSSKEKVYIKISTDNLLYRIQNNPEIEWEKDNVLIEPCREYSDVEDPLISIVLLNSRRDCDTAIIYRDEFFEALLLAEKCVV